MGGETVNPSISSFRMLSRFFFPALQAPKNAELRLFFSDFA